MVDGMSEFIAKLREEILTSQERRAALTKHKLSFVIATFGLGAITADKFETIGLLFLAPIIAFAFDLYIAGEDFGIKRAGGFLGRPDSSADVEEREWEKRVRKYGDPFSKFANPFVSIIVLISAAVLLWNQYHATNLYSLWLFVNVILIIAVWVYSHFANKAVRLFKEKIENTAYEE